MKGDKCKQRDCDGCTPESCPGTGKCRAYSRAQRREQYARDPSYDRQYYADHKEEYAYNHRVYYNNNIDECKERDAQYRKENKDRRFLTSALHNHQVKGHDVDVTADELEDLFNKTNTCRYCGVKLNKKDFGHRMDGPSIDRINNETVLHINNVQFICRRCNTCKGSKTHDEFVSYAKRIALRAEVLCPRKVISVPKGTV